MGPTHPLPPPNPASAAHAQLWPQRCTCLCVHMRVCLCVCVCTLQPAHVVPGGDWPHTVAHAWLRCISIPACSAHGSCPLYLCLSPDGQGLPLFGCCPCTACSSPLGHRERWGPPGTGVDRPYVGSCPSSSVFSIIPGPPLFLLSPSPVGCFLLVQCWGVCGLCCRALLAAQRCLRVRLLYDPPSTTIIHHHHEPQPQPKPQPNRLQHC